MKLDWKKLCYEEVLDYHPDRLADRMADYLGKEIEKNFKVAYSIDIVLARQTVNIFIEMTETRVARSQIIEFIETSAKLFLYEQVDLDECLGMSLKNLKIIINVFPQSSQLAEKLKYKHASNDNCIINFYQSDALKFVKNTFKRVKSILASYPNVMRDGKMILAYSELVQNWVCFLTLCFTKSSFLEIKKTVQKIESYQGDIILKVVNVEKENIWYPPASFASDIGVTGRKLQSDFFYGLAPHQQGSIHGKDLSKYDRYGYEKLKHEYKHKKNIFVSETWLNGGKEPLNTYEEEIENELF